MRVEVGFSDIPNSAAAGKQAAEQAIHASGRQDPCDMALLFCTARHDPLALRKAVAAVIGGARIYGGGAVGIITNETFGYAGDQVGIACLWLEGSRCDALIDGGLLGSEQEAGARLGRGLAERGTTPDSPVVLFYDAIDRRGENMRLVMATWLLAGMEKGLGFLPDIVGAGMQGDHMCTPTRQYVGDETGEHFAMALKFSDDLRIDSTIMHGCRPASPYYTVTRAEGPVILEINDTPALEFMDALLGPNVVPEDYPFFLLFGINHGERWGAYDENNYASRLCLGIDKDRGGIVMFEPDMVEGTKFQLMFRSLNLNYMKPKIEALFDRLDGREPVFAMYINCAGRCAGYGGMDVEDAIPLQQLIAGRVPLLGFYTGVEIAPIGGRPRGLDWTGVLCLFSRRRPGGQEAAREHAPVWNSAAARQELDTGIPLATALKLGEENAARVLMLDMQMITLRHELEIKRRGFRLLAELAVSLRRVASHEHLLSQVSQRINAALNMQKTVVLLPEGGGLFTPQVLRGFAPEEEARLAGRHFALAPEFLDPETPLLVTTMDAPERFADLRRMLDLPCFIALPVILQNEVAAVLLTGRMVEQPPYLGRLVKNDVETVQAISELLGSVLIRQRLENVTLQAESDPLTGLWNRTTFKQKVERYLEENERPCGAYLMIDIDYFKQVNDNHGHATGDDVLLACAAAMRRTLRDSDIIGRYGGDEFAVFCKGIEGAEAAKNRAKRVGEAWRKIIPKGGENPVTASIGIALAPRDGTSFEALFHNADAALYKVKERGRDGFALFGDG